MSQSMGIVSDLGTHAATRPLNLVFWDLYQNPEDLAVWSGTTASMIQGLRNSGHHVTTAGRVLPTLKRGVSSVLWHYYQRVRKQHYIPDRHLAVTRFFSWVNNIAVRRSFRHADAIVTTSTTATAFLKTDKPIILVHDATWGQVLESYAYFHPSKQVPYVVRDGFAMEKMSFSRPNVTLVLSSAWAAQRAVSDYALDPQRVHVLPFGANFAKDPPREQVVNAIHARSGKHCNLLFVGREFERKGGPIAVAAAAALDAMGVPTSLHVVGCEPTGLPAWVKVHGRLRKDDPGESARLHELYAGSDFFILPTQAEAQGIVFNEAAAYGLPVAAADVGGVSAVVADGDWGKLFPASSSGDRYALWLAELFRDRDRYTATALRARADYEARLSRAVYSDRLTSIIRDILPAGNQSG